MDNHVRDLLRALVYARARQLGRRRAKALLDLGVRRTFVKAPRKYSIRAELRLEPARLDEDDPDAERMELEIEGIAQRFS